MGEVLDRWAPAFAGLHERRRIRTMAAVILVLGGCVTVLLALNLALQIWFFAGVCALILPVFVLALSLLRRGRWELAANLVTGAAWMALATALLLSGASESISLAWALIMPLLAGLLGGKRSCILWTGITVLTALGLFHPAAGELPVLISVGGAELSPIYLVSQLLVIAGVTLALLVNQRWAEEQIEDSFTKLREEIERRTIAELEAREAAELKATFLANMSHEIRTPMNGVIGMSSLLQETPLNAEQRDFVSTLRTSAETLLVLINDILDYSKVSAGKVELELQSFDLHRAVSEVGELLAPAAAAKQLELIVSVPSDVPLGVRGDVTRLRQVLTNLLSNAIKFTAEGQVALQVSLASTADERASLRFEVRDTGIGIAPERAKSIFESFQQADSSTTREYGGTGLGLAISRSLVELMGGTLELDSALGQGSTFSFTLDLPLAELALPSYLRPRGSLDGTRALIVDDNQTNRELLEHYGRRWGLETVALESAAAALARPDVGEFDLYLLDFHMPGMDGLALARELRARGVDAPLLMLSSLDKRGEFNEAVAAGILSAQLTKPLRPELVYEAVRASLSRAAAAPREQPVQPAEAPRGPSLSVLMAEDNVINQKVGRMILERLGHRVHTVGNGQEALDTLGLRPYDVVLMDVMMPELDGLEATRRIRADPRLRSAYVIALTANAMQGDREQCLEAGADDYLAKPIILEELAASLARVVPRPGSSASRDRPPGLV